MDLFTVDTAGDADLLNANVADDETKYVTRGFTIENVDDTNQSDDGDEDEEEETHDYYGELIWISFFFFNIFLTLPFMCT